MKASNAILEAIERAEADEVCRYALLRTEGNQAHLLISHRAGIPESVVLDASPVVLCDCGRPNPRHCSMGFYCSYCFPVEVDDDDY